MIEFLAEKGTRIDCRDAASETPLSTAQKGLWVELAILYPLAIAQGIIIPSQYPSPESEAFAKGCGMQ